MSDEKDKEQCLYPCIFLPQKQKHLYTKLVEAFAYSTFRNDEMTIEMKQLTKKYIYGMPLKYRYDIDNLFEADVVQYAASKFYSFEK